MDLVQNMMLKTSLHKNELIAVRAWEHSNNMHHHHQLNVVKNFARVPGCQTQCWGNP